MNPVYMHSGWSAKWLSSRHCLRRIKNDQYNLMIYCINMNMAMQLHLQIDRFFDLMISIISQIICQSAWLYIVSFNLLALSTMYHGFKVWLTRYATGFQLITCNWNVCIDIYLVYITWLRCGYQQYHTWAEIAAWG